MEAKENNSSRKSPGASSEAERRGSSTDGRQGTNSDDRDTDANGRGSESSNAPKLYHTLTACTRCRSVRAYCYLFIVPGVSFLTIINSEKLAVMRACPNVGHVNGVERTANFSIRRSRKRSQEVMSSICKIRSGTWRSN